MKTKKIKQYTGQDVARLLEVEDRYKKVVNEAEIQEMEVQQKLDAARKNFFNSEPTILNSEDFNIEK